MNLFAKNKQRLLMLKPVEGGAFDWALSSEDLEVASVGTATLDDIACGQEISEADSVCLIIPASDAYFGRLEIDAREMRYASRSIPYRLEDQILDDIEDLHFAFKPIDRKSVSVAAIRRDLLTEQLKRCEDAGISVDACFPEQLFVPVGPGSLIYASAGYLLVRVSADAEPVCVDLAHADVALQKLVTETHESPVRVLVLEDSARQRIAGIAEALNLAISEEPVGLPELVFKAESWSQKLNLLQGEFAPKIQWTRHFQAWRNVAALLLVAAVLHTVVGVASYYQNTRTDQTLRGEIEAVYRSVFPQGELVDASSQMRRQLSQLRNSGGGAGFVNRFYPVAELLETRGSMTLYSVRYDGRSEDLTLEIGASSHDGVETLLRQLTEHTLNARLVSSSTNGKEVRARVSIK